MGTFPGLCVHHKAEAESRSDPAVQGERRKEGDVCMENQKTQRRTKHPRVTEAQLGFQDAPHFLTQNSGSALPVWAGSLALPQRTVMHVLPSGVFYNKESSKVTLELCLCASTYSKSHTLFGKVRDKSVLVGHVGTGPHLPRSLKGGLCSREAVKMCLF